MLRLAKYPLLDPYGPLGTPKPLPGSCFRIVRHLISDSVQCVTIDAKIWYLLFGLFPGFRTLKRSFLGFLAEFRNGKESDNGSTGNAV